MTFKEYTAHRAESYMSEPVDGLGRSREEADTSYFNVRGPRLTVLMGLYIKEELDKAAKTAVTDVNKVLAKNIQKVAVESISKMAESIKITIS